MKKLISVTVFLLILFFAPKTFAQNNSFVSIVNPIRGSDFWETKDQNPETAIAGQIDILKKINLPATWLVRFDALGNQQIISQLTNRSADEKGLFLEVTPTWAEAAAVGYHTSASWHAAGSSFLSGYERWEREKLVDAAFAKFKRTFGYYPSSVGAWWIDAYSLGYMKDKYEIISALIVADQYSTDNYQIWGQYFGTPYYPAQNNVLHPAQTLENKLDVVMMQWAARDPVNGYGNGVLESTFSLQANDYLDFHDLNTKYFSSLVDIYTKQQFNQFGQMVVGLENSYLWNDYSKEYENQIKTLVDKRNAGQLIVAPMKDFALWYRSTFPTVSPPHLIVADDPLGSSKKAVWFMNPYYRVGWFFNADGSVFRDIRQYIEGEEELCFKVRCNSVNFATSATRVLDDVSFGHKWVVDGGRISDFRVEKKGDDFILSYKNEAGNSRQIGLMSRDISINEKIFSIDGAILNATKKDVVTKSTAVSGGNLEWSFVSVVIKISKFLIFLVAGILLPGLALTDRTFKNSPIFLRIFLSIASSLVMLTLLFYIASLLKARPLIFVYILAALIFSIRYLKNCSILQGVFSSVARVVKQPFNSILVCLILAGTIFQVIPTFKSGLNFSYGLGFWGPNSHDGIWHMALVNQLSKAIPPENPIFSGVVLKNYHFFYDLLVAATGYLSTLPISDLIFRFYPMIFSLLLGIGSYYLIIRLFEKSLGGIKARVAAFFSLYLIYFAGSFGWIVEFLRERHLGGESAFWVNQAVSFNLNPPFAVSLVIMIAIAHLLLNFPIKWPSKLLATMLLGTLASFKSYTGILVLGAFLVIAVVRILKNRDFSYLLIFLLSSLLTGWLFLSNFETGIPFLIFAPFWFIHTMVDSPDRVGWVRLSLARTTAFTLGQWPKFIAAEIVSFVLFVIGNLGMRFLSFGLIFKLSEIFKNDTLLFLLVILLVSIGIPILFIQSGNPWNTIQFFYPALYLSALFSGVVMSYLVFKLNRVLAAILILAVLVMAPINSLVTASGYFGKNPHAFIPAKELAGLKFLSGQPDGTILTYPYDGKLKQKLPESWPILAYDSTAYVAALTGKSVYLEDEPQNQIILTDYKKRLVASKDFFLKPISESAEFLKDNKIKYIYLPKIYNVRLDESIGIVESIFENEEVLIYKVN